MPKKQTLKPSTKRNTASYTKAYSKTKKRSSVSRQSRLSTLLSFRRLSRARLVLVAVLFAAIGSYFVFFSKAATVTLATIEAETIAASTYADASASNGQAAALYSNATITGTFSNASPATSLTIRAKGSQCRGAPNMVVSIDGGRQSGVDGGVTSETSTPSQSFSVSSTTWTDYSFNADVAPGSHTFSISFTNDYWRKCDRNLFIDKATVYGTVADAVNNTSNLAAGKTVTSNDPDAESLQRLTDGDLSTLNYVGMNSGPRYVQIDLGQSQSIGKVNFWHYFGDGRNYRDVIVQLSNAADFSSGKTTIFNNDRDNSSGQGAGTDSEYVESSAGKSIVPASAVNARYVRIWSNGSNVNIWNHYVEAQVFTSGSTSTAPTPTPTPTPTPAPAPSALLSANFDGPDGIFASSAAFWADGGLAENPDWFSESYTFYRRGNTGWTDAPGQRLWTRRTDLAFTKMEMDIKFNGWSGGSYGWEGVNLWLNRKLISGSRVIDGPQQEGYVVDFLNRDGKLYLMKKSGNGDEDYHILNTISWKPVTGQWYRWGGRVIDNGNGTSTIQVLVNGQVIQQAVDNGSIGGPRLFGGRAGLRSDYANINVDNLSFSR